MKKFLIAAAATIISGSAFAADMPVKVPAVASAPWTGWYIGINGGGVWGDTKPQLSDIGGDLNRSTQHLRNAYQMLA